MRSYNLIVFSIKGKTYDICLGYDVKCIDNQNLKLKIRSRSIDLSFWTLIICWFSMSLVFIKNDRFQLIMFRYYNMFIYIVRSHSAIHRKTRDFQSTSYVSIPSCILRAKERHDLFSLSQGLWIIYTSWVTSVRDEGNT